MIPVDRDGDALYNAINWLDGRAEAEAAYLKTVNICCFRSMLQQALYFQALLRFLSAMRIGDDSKSEGFRDVILRSSSSAARQYAQSPAYCRLLHESPSVHDCYSFVSVELKCINA